MHDVNCPFCAPDLRRIALENAHALFLIGTEPVLVGSGVIVPRAHRATVFDLTPEEWMATFAHLHVIPTFADEPYAGNGIRHWLKSEANRRPSR